MRTPYPLFRVPLDLWKSVPTSALDEMVYAQDGDHILIYEAPDRVLGWWLPDDDGDELRMEDMLYRYTPSPEEVMRALQGPPGPVGMAGEPGDPAPTPEEGTDDYRLAVLEKTIQTVASQVTDLMHKVNDQKEQ